VLRADPARDRLGDYGIDVSDVTYRELVAQPGQRGQVDGLRYRPCTQKPDTDSGLHPWLLTRVKPDQSFRFGNVNAW
jgi:hypothetical protein